LSLNYAQVFSHAQDADVNLIQVFFFSHGPGLLKSNISFTFNSEQMSHVHALS